MQAHFGVAVVRATCVRVGDCSFVLSRDSAVRSAYGDGARAWETKKTLAVHAQRVMALPVALFVPTVVACIVIIAYLVQAVLRLQALQVTLQRSKSAQMVKRYIPWDATTPLLQSAFRGYGLRTAATPWVAFLVAAGWALLLLPGLAFLHWEPAAFWAPTPWLRPSSALGRAEALRRASFSAPLDALELLVAPTDTSVSVLSFEHLDGLVNLHNAVTGTELCRKHVGSDFTQLALRRLLSVPEHAPH